LTLIGLNVARSAGRSTATTQHIEFPGVMDLIDVDAVTERLDGLMASKCAIQMKD
jgi:hypothetical protein